jgi:hypothetical protein
MVLPSKRESHLAAKPAISIRSETVNSGERTRPRVLRLAPSPIAGMNAIR